jgi:hypothetical protein
MTGVFARWRVRTAALLAAGLCSTTILPMITAAPASAQLFRRQPEDFRPQDNGGDDDNYRRPEDYRRSDEYRRTDDYRRPDEYRRTDDYRRPNDDYGDNYRGGRLYGQLPAGTVIPSTYEGGSRILVKPDETLQLKLTVSRDVYDPRGGLLIPAGSEIDGQLEPSRGGTQYVARQIRLRNGGSYNLSARSPVITRIETVRRGAGTRTIVTGAVAGGATATIISAALGEVGVLKSLGGAGVGALSGFFLGRRSVDVVVVDAKSDLELTLDNNFRVN